MRSLVRVTLILLMVGVGVVQASDVFNVANGNWTNAANWNLGHVPSADDVEINNGDTATYTGGGPTFTGYMKLGNESAGTLSINSGSLTNTAAFGNFGFTVGINPGGSGNLILGAGAGTL